MTVRGSTMRDRDRSVVPALREVTVGVLTAKDARAVMKNLLGRKGSPSGGSRVPYGGTARVMGSPPICTVAVRLGSVGSGRDVRTWSGLRRGPQRGPARGSSPVTGRQSTGDERR